MGRMSQRVATVERDGSALQELRDAGTRLTVQMEGALPISPAWRETYPAWGTVVAPSMTYLTPLSRATAVVFNVSAEHVDTAYARYYFDVSPAGAVASGLPGYTARGGWKNAGATLMGVVDLDGNLLNGGFALVGGIAYTRLLGSIRDSPIVSERGSANQLVGALGVALTF